MGRVGWASELLNSLHPALRAWTVQLIGDACGVSAAMAHGLDVWAELEPAITSRAE